MEKILSRSFYFLKHILLVLSFGCVFYGLMNTFQRLEKPITDGIDIFIPFALLLLLFIISLFKKGKYLNDNLMFNFLCCIVFICIIYVFYRAKFDTNMILYLKYDRGFNPAYFSDNLSIIKSMLYMLSFINVILLICSFIDKDNVSVSKTYNKFNNVLNKDSDSYKHLIDIDSDKE